MNLPLFPTLISTSPQQQQPTQPIISNTTNIVNKPTHQTFGAQNRFLTGGQQQSLQQQQQSSSLQQPQQQVNTAFNPNVGMFGGSSSGVKSFANFG